MVLLPAHPLGAALMAAAVRALPVANAFYVRPVAHGAATGLSWSDAVSLVDLPRCLTSLNPNGTVYIAAYDGSYTIDATLNSILLSWPAGRGSATIKGVNADLSPAKATINGTRHAYDGTNYLRSTDPLNDGYDAFQIASGAADLSFSFLRFTNIGWCFNALGGALRLTITDCDAANVSLPFNNILNLSGASSKANTEAFDTLTLQRLTATGYEIGMLKIGQIIGDRVLIEDCTGDALHYVGNNNSFQEGIHLRGEIQLATINRCRMDNSQWTNSTGSGYWNGDGFATETSVVTANYTDCEANGSTDGGWDDKAQTVTRTRCIARDNKINFRSWGPSVTMTDCESHLPAKRGGSNDPDHFQFNGGGGATHAVQLTRQIVTGNATHEAPIFYVSDT